MRKKKKQKKQTDPDPKYNSTLAAKFINHLMKDGKKSLAQKAFYEALDKVAKENKDQDPLDVFDSAIKNASPKVEVRSKRVGGARYQVPREVKGERRTTLAIRWVLQSARSKKGKPISVRLAEEFTEAAKGEGTAVKKKEEMHKVAEANKAFAHFAW
jgi:small subunit ribosomal protein S7